MRKIVTSVTAGRCTARFSGAAVAAALVFAACTLDAADEPAAPVSPATAQAQSPLTAFLTGCGITGRVALVQYGMIGCELSGQGLDAMMQMRESKQVPGLGFARVEAEQAQDKVDAYYAAKKPGFAVHHDADSSVAKALQVSAFPSYVLIDKFGRIRYRGSFPRTQIDDWAKVLLAEAADRGEQAPMFVNSQTDIPQLLKTTCLPELKGDGTKKPLGDRMGTTGLMAVFVDTQCPFSQQIIGELPQAVPALTKQGIVSLLVNLDESGTQIQGFYSRRKPGVPILYDETACTRTNWGIASVPTVVLMDKDGKVAYNGPAVWQKIADAGEKGLGLPAGSLQFKTRGTEFG